MLMGDMVLFHQLRLHLVSVTVVRLLASLCFLNGMAGVEIATKGESG